MNELLQTTKEITDYKEMEMLMKYCEIISKAPAYAAMGGMPGIFALVMTARELGIGPMAALNGGMYLIPPKIDRDGKPMGHPTIMMAAKTMSMMILRAGHSIEAVTVSATKVTLRGTRCDTGKSLEVTMTSDDARTAHLSHDAFGKPKLFSAWFKNPEDMLWKTCVSKLSRRLFTDVIGNCYEPSEFSESRNEGSDNSDLTATKTQKRLSGKKISSKKLDDSREDVLTLELNESREKFCERLSIPLKIDDNENEIAAFIKRGARRRSISYDEMIDYCKENEANFMASFKDFQEKTAHNKDVS